MTVLARGLDRPESVAWDPTTASLVCGGASGQLYRVEPASGAVHEFANTGGSVLGVAVDGLGRLYVCDKGLSAVLRIDPVSGAQEDLTADAGTASPSVPNFLAFAPGGDLYVSDSGHLDADDGRLLIVRVDGTVEVAGDVARAYPNGLAISPSGDRLFVVETSRPGVSVFDLRADGRLGNEREFIPLPRTVPDGIAVTDDGRLVIACWRPDALLLVDGTRVSVLFEDWRGLAVTAPTNACFYGPALAELAVANRGSSHLSRLEIGMTGAAPHAPFG